MKMDSKSYDLWMAVAAIVTGLLFVIWPASIVGWLVMFVGILSLVTGAVQLIAYFATPKTESGKRTGFPLIGILAVIWGALLLIRPDIWVNLFMIVMSVPMILLAVGQLAMLTKKQKAGFVVPWGYYVFPVLLIFAGITVMFNPFASALWLVFFVGIWAIAYGIAEMVNYFVIKH